MTTLASLASYGSSKGRLTNFFELSYRPTKNKNNYFIFIFYL